MSSSDTGLGAVASRRCCFTQTHGQPLASPTTDTAAIEAAALAALDRFTSRRAVGLLGVRAEFA
jgi:DNA polymerase-4